MITTKVREQVQEAMKGITESNSKRITELREDIFEKMGETRKINEQAHNSITTRLDNLMGVLLERKQ